MPSISIDIPSGAHLTRIVNAYVIAFGYQAAIDGIPNTETPNQFTKRQVALQIKNIVREIESYQAAETARASAQAAADALNIT